MNKKYTHISKNKHRITHISVKGKRLVRPAWLNLPPIMKKFRG